MTTSRLLSGAIAVLAAATLIPSASCSLASQDVAAGIAPGGQSSEGTASTPFVATPWPDDTLALPVAGNYRLTVISPTVLELELVTEKLPNPAPAGPWDFEKAIPAPEAFDVQIGGQTVPVKAVGFKRRPIYVPLKHRDLRVANWLYLVLANPVAPGSKVEVKDARGDIFPAGAKFSATADDHRFSPVLHTNEAGYVPDLPKMALVGYYLGSLGELHPDANSFELLDSSGHAAFTGTLQLRPDTGWGSNPYAHVLAADFTAFKTPGQYRLHVAGLGESQPFTIADDVAAQIARTYALGLYHQRCGQALGLPFTRFTHEACHTAPADVPTMAFAATNKVLDNMTGDGKPNPRFTAPRLSNVDASLFPFVKQGKIDVSGGHHDAGDYSVYTISSATLISRITFAADAFPGAGDLDNLGIPESGDGKSDLLEEAKWEADYLLKMQDDDGGFFFLKYPRDRQYEDNVTPDEGDPQVVFPKNTAVTAAATAALAQMATSSRFKAQFPEAAAKDRAAALHGWQFLQAAIAKYGRDGCYQKISHYGDTFGHDDELLWAAVEISFLTGDKSAAEPFIANFNPSDLANLHWGWERLFECYGNAIREYAFAPQTGRATEAELDPRFLKACRDEIVLAANDQLARANASAYGTSFPLESKHINVAGWYFSSGPAYDLATGYSLTPRADYLAAIVSNINYEWGANPVNEPFVTGIGWQRRHEIVNQWSQNARWSLPPTGLIQGNVVSGFMWLNDYGREPGQMTFPSEGDANAPYPMLDRWSDAFNVTAEPVVGNQASALGVGAFLMGRSSLKTQAWRDAPATISGLPALVKVGQPVVCTLSVPGLDTADASIVWEAHGCQPVTADDYHYSAPATGLSWIEAEALWPDGRRAFAVKDFPVYAASNGQPALKTASTKLLLDFDGLNGSSGDALQTALAAEAPGSAVTGAPRVDADNLTWMESPAGAALHFVHAADGVSVPVTSGSDSVALSARVYIQKTPFGVAQGPALALCGRNDNDLRLGLWVDRWSKPPGAELRMGNTNVLDSAALAPFVHPDTWQLWQLGASNGQIRVQVDGQTVYSAPGVLSGSIVRVGLGHFVGWVDDVHVEGAG